MKICPWKMVGTKVGPSLRGSPATQEHLAILPVEKSEQEWWEETRPSRKFAQKWLTVDMLSRTPAPSFQTKRCCFSSRKKNRSVVEWGVQSPPRTASHESPATRAHALWNQGRQAGSSALPRLPSGTLKIAHYPHQQRLQIWGPRSWRLGSVRSGIQAQTFLEKFDSSSLTS